MKLFELWYSCPSCEHEWNECHPSVVDAVECPECGRVDQIATFHRDEFEATDKQIIEMASDLASRSDAHDYVAICTDAKVEPCDGEGVYVTARVFVPFSQFIDSEDE